MTPSLNLTYAPNVLFLFGLSGAGKSYVGDVIGQHSGWHVYHADEDLTQEMRRVISEQKPFTEQMRDDFFVKIVSRIKQLQKQHKKIVVTQGAYKNKHRHYLLQSIDDLELIMVSASDSLIHKRLEHRHNGISNQSAAAIKHVFETPNHLAHVIENNEGAEFIIQQLNALYANARSAAA
ncbi:TPA: shikimate kinase [Photobacterium damselae]